MLAKKLLSAAKAVEPVFIEDTFAVHLYTGNGSTQTITNGIDLAGKGGLVWNKNRTQVDNNRLYDTVRGTNNVLISNSTSAALTDSNTVTAFNSNGYSIGSSGNVNFNGDNFASWTFRKQPKFFDVVTYTGNGASNRSISHNLGSTPGCIIIKRTDSSDSWIVWHRAMYSDPSILYEYYLRLNSTDAIASTYNNIWGNSNNVTSTSFQISTSGAVNASGGTYVAYLFAHNAGGFGLTGTDNVISCGSYTGTGAANNAVTLGWEPQWLLIKRSSESGNDWWLFDNMRGLTMGIDADLRANLSQAEENAVNYIDPTATGFALQTTNAALNASGSTYIYIAIRRGPMKVPTDGTKVFSPNTTTGSTGASVTTNFPVDFQITRNGARSAVTSNIAVDRLRGVSTTTTDGGVFLGTTSTNAESSAVAFTRAWGNTGFQVPTQNANVAQIYWNFRRAPGFFDVVCYTGTGSARTVSHNLGVAPELMIVKSRSQSGGSWNTWTTGFTISSSSNEYVALNSTSAKQDKNTSEFWGSSYPTASVFGLGDNFYINNSGSTYVAYLFASCPGVSKCFSYTGNGSSQTINCGFTGGARFVLIKRTDSTGNWVTFDSARGIVAGNDPALYLNSTAAEVTGVDAIDTDSTGFIVNQETTFNLNVNGATYIGLAIS